VFRFSPLLINANGALKGVILPVWYNGAVQTNENPLIEMIPQMKTAANRQGMLHRSGGYIT
jgi:hypothetical protein